MSVQLRPMREDEFVALSVKLDERARTLYRNLGYDVAAVHMSKALA